MNYNSLYHSARASGISTQSSCQFLQWQPPPVGWVCLHVDGAVNIGSGLGSIGGLFRNSVGSWISGYGRNIRFSDVLTSELWAIHDGLALAWNSGFRKLQVRSDCTMAISLIMNSDLHTAHMPWCVLLLAFVDVPGLSTLFGCPVKSIGQPIL
ncbi:hypothetical protein GQ457_16G004170 [Hibiscus cannabinus]